MINLEETKEMKGLIDGRGDGKVDVIETKEMKKLNKECLKAERACNWKKLEKLYAKRNSLTLQNFEN